MEKDEIDKKLKKIKLGWKNNYFLSLGIYQHLIECSQKFEAWKNHSIIQKTKEELEKELNKELADLKILLDIYTDNETYEKRLDKFLENIDKSK